MDGRRHSVDVPISKTLVALRRVRSLRDPSTNSMTKFSSLVDNLNWDTNSFNGISLKFGNGCKEDLTNDNGRHKTCKDMKSNETSPKSNSKLNVRKKSGCVGQSDSNAGHSENELELACVSPSNDHLEGAGSNHDTPIRRKHHSSTPNGGYHYRSPLGSMGDLVSRANSPSLGFSGTLPDEIDVLEQAYRGCGLTCCWSRTPRYRDTSLASDGEEYPLISGETGDTDISDSPTTLSQKFRPKSFDELVGQSVAVRSLLGAILKGRVASFYLFHGPRGVGKTSASKIFAAALNCLSHTEQRPCGSCQECMLYFAGRSRDVKEVDSMRINRAGRLRSLIKRASLPPVSSKFKVFILEECHLLRSDTWAAFLSSLNTFSQHVVFVMITHDLDKLPRSVVARSQRYHFPKLKDVDVASRLRKICIEEGLKFEEVSLDLIAAKSNGSLRDAEMMLDQLSLLGSHITRSLAYELIGTVSDDELLDLLDLALSADTSNTVKRARELMRSRVDPMQLISQLANIIMDVLSGKCGEDDSDARRNFLRKHASEKDLQKLRHALKILSDSEKQLRMSKSQTTWLTVALLQLNSVDPSFSDPNESRLSARSANSEEDECCCTSSPDGRSKNLARYDCADVESRKVVTQGACEVRFESVWNKVTEMCQPNSLKNFLRKHGKLTCVWMKKDMAVAELEFDHPEHASKAEKSWKSIASSLQSVLGCNVEIRINLTNSCAKTKRSSFNLFNCSRRVHKTQADQTESGNEHIDTCSSCGSQISHVCHHRLVRTLRNSDGNTLSTGRSEATTPQRFSHDNSSKDKMCKVLRVEGQEGRPKEKIGEASFDTYICTDYPYIVSNGCNNGDVGQHGDGKPKESKSHCWRTPPFPMKKGWRMKHQQRQRSHLVGWVLPCAAAK